MKKYILVFAMLFLAFVGNLSAQTTQKDSLNKEKTQVAKDSLVIKNVTKKDTTLSKNSTDSTKNIVKKSNFASSKDSLIALALTPIQMAFFKAEANKITIQFQENLNKFANPSLSANEVHRYIEPTIALFRPLNQSVEKEDTRICIENDLKGNRNISISSYLHILQVYTAQQYHEVKFDSLKISEVYWKNGYRVRVWFDRKISPKTGSIQVSKRQLFILFEQDKAGQWQTRIDKYLNASILNDSTLVPLRKIQFTKPEKTANKSDKNKEVTMYKGKDKVAIEWSDSVFSQTKSIKKSFAVKDTMAVQVDLYKDKIFIKQLGISNNGSFNWTVGNMYGNYGKGFQFKISSLKNPTLSKTLDSAFSIKCDTCKVLRYINFTSKMCKQIEYSLGDSIEFEWESEGIDYLKIGFYPYDEVENDTSKTPFMIADKLLNKNTYKWKMYSDKQYIGRKFLFKVWNYSNTPLFYSWCDCVITFRRKEEEK